MDEHTAPHWRASALLTIDLQHDFCTGPYAVPGTTEVLPAVAALTDAYRSAGLPIVHVVRLYLPDASNADLCRRTLLGSGTGPVLTHTPGSQPSAVDTLVDPDLLLGGDFQAVGPGEYLMYKPRWSAFHRTALLDHLTALGVDTVVVAGCNFPNCPRATLIDATERDLRTVAVSDALSRWIPGDLDGIGVLSLPSADVLRAVAGVTAVATTGARPAAR